MRLYIIRHAEPDYENQTITEAGHREAAALADRLAPLGLARIFCSPKGRALDTMRYTADRVHLEPVVEEWLQEWPHWYVDTAQAGRMAVWDVPGELIRGQGELPTRETWHETPPLDEPVFREQFADVRAHSDDFLRRLGYERVEGRYRAAAPTEERIAVFCHMGLGLVWLAHLLEFPLSLVWSGFWLPPSSVTTVVWERRSREWAVPRCLGVGDVSHLAAAGLPVSGSGLHSGEDGAA